MLQLVQITVLYSISSPWIYIIDTRKCAIKTRKFVTKSMRVCNLTHAYADYKMYVPMSIAIDQRNYSTTIIAVVFSYFSVCCHLPN